MSRPPVVVVGLDCPTGLQTARTFDRYGIEVIGVATDVGHACARTRACREIVPTGSGVDEIVETLLEIGKRASERPVLIPCTDLAVLGIARHQDELSTHYHMSVPSVGVTELLLDKARFADFAQRHDLPVPVTRVIRSRTDAERAASDIAFPCVFKPAVKTVAWTANARSKAIVAESPDELVTLYDEHRAWSDTFVAQEWIAGGDTDHYTCDCYLDRGGDALVTFTTRKLRQWPPTVGQGCLSVEHRDDFVSHEAVRVLQAADHRGQGYLEMKRDARTGRCLIIEANVGRPTGRSAAAERAGVELLMTVYCDLAGLPLPEARTQRFGGTKWIHLRRDLQASVHALVRGEAGVLDILESWRGPLAFGVFSWSDPVPFVADAIRALRGAVRRRLRTRRELASKHEPRRPLPAAPTDVATRRAGPAPADTVDFELTGITRVRVLDATPADLRAVSRDLGPPVPTGEGSPDVVVCFVDDLAPTSLRLMDGGSTAYGDGGVYFLDTPGGHPIAHVRTGSVWGSSIIVCRRGVTRVPSLAAVRDVQAIGRGWAPLHASAWSVDGVGVIAAGWAHSGKTGALLAACHSGASSVGDDRVYLSGDGSRVVGARKPVEVRAWHLAQLDMPTLGVGPARRALARVAPALERIGNRIVDSGGARLRPLTRAAHKVLRKLRTSLDVELPHDRLEHDGREHRSAHPDVFVLLESHADPSFSARPVDARTLSGRLSAQLKAELMPALRTQLSQEYARPGSGWRNVHMIPEVGAELVRKSTRDARAYVLRHPYPCSLDRLHRAIDTLVAKGRLEAPVDRSVPERRPLHAPRRVAL